jgi:hypothetical protein
MLLPPPKVQEGVLSRLKTHSKKFVGKRGVKEIRAHFQGNHMFLQVVKEAKGGLIGRLFGMGEVRGVGRLARLEYLGPNKWKFLIYKYDTQKYAPYSDLKEGTIEECLDAAARVFLV